MKKENKFEGILLLSESKSNDYKIFIRKSEVNRLIEYVKHDSNDKYANKVIRMLYNMHKSIH